MMVVAIVLRLLALAAFIPMISAQDPFPSIGAVPAFPQSSVRVAVCSDCALVCTNSLAQGLVLNCTSTGACDSCLSRVFPSVTSTVFLSFTGQTICTQLATSVNSYLVSNDLCPITPITSGDPISFPTIPFPTTFARPNSTALTLSLTDSRGISQAGATATS